MIAIASRFDIEVADLIVSEAARIVDLSGQSRRVAGRLLPRNAQDVVRIVRCRTSRGPASSHLLRQKLGFGSALPKSRETWVVDLSRLARIHSYEPETGSICIGPGVTQLALYRKLQQQGAEWFFNVTGAGHSVSVLGNALERGIGYYGQRQHDLIELQVVTGSGEIINTRLSHPFHGSPLLPLGTDLTQLFAQSCFGIVVSARLRLIKRTDGGGAAIVRLKDACRTREFFNSILKLKQDGCIAGVPHIGNKNRIIVTMAPWLPAEQVPVFASKAAPWTAALPVTGCREMTEAAFSLIRQRMAGFCDIETIVASRKPIDSTTIASPAEQLQQLASGYPSNLAIPGVEWAAQGRANCSNSDPESNGAGLIHVTPAVPSTAAAIERALRTVKRAGLETGLGNLPVTVNMVDPRSTVLVISIGFAAASAREVKARARKFEAQLRREGLRPYRIGLGQEQWLPRASAAARDIFGKLKAAFDPHDVLAASKYDHAFGAIRPNRMVLRRPSLETCLEAA